MTMVMLLVRLYLLLMRLLYNSFSTVIYSKNVSVKDRLHLKIIPCNLKYRASLNKNETAFSWKSESYEININ